MIYSKMFCAKSCLCLLFLVFLAFIASPAKVEADCNNNCGGFCRDPGWSCDLCTGICSKNDTGCIWPPSYHYGWSTCPVSCGGGTQENCNQCGADCWYQACNTQSCCTPTSPVCGTFSPPNPSTFPTTAVALNANAGTWGTGCPGNDNRVTYQVSSDNFATNLSLPANCASTPAGNGCIAGLPAYDTTYKWRAILNNGSNSVTCGPWTIITKSTPAWWQAVGGGDIYGVMVQSKVPDTVPAERRFIILN